MHTSHPTWRGRLAAGAMVIAAGGLLAACGSGEKYVPQVVPTPSTPTPPTVPVTPPAPVIDSFFSFVLARVAALLDGDEPVAIDAVAVTTPENTEPEAVQ